MLGLLPDISTFIFYMTALLGLVLSPGPDMLYVVARGMVQGSLAGVVSALGVCTGVLIHTLALAFGLSSLFAATPLAFEIVRWLGATYLLYLGVKTLMDQSPPPKLSTKGHVRSHKTLFMQGLLTNVLNPKVALFFVAFLPQFADPTRGNMPLQLLLLGLCVVILGLIVKITVGVFSGKMGEWMSTRPLVWRTQRWLSASILIGLSMRLVVIERN